MTEVSCWMIPQSWKQFRCHLSPQFLGCHLHPREFVINNKSTSPVMKPGREHINATNQAGHISMLPSEQTISGRCRFGTGAGISLAHLQRNNMLCWSLIRQICSYLESQCISGLGSCSSPWAAGSAHTLKPGTWKSLLAAPFAAVPSNPVNCIS